MREDDPVTGSRARALRQDGDIQIGYSSLRRRSSNRRPRSDLVFEHRPARDVSTDRQGTRRNSQSLLVSSPTTAAVLEFPTARAVRYFERAWTTSMPFSTTRASTSRGIRAQRSWVAVRDVCRNASGQGDGDDLVRIVRHDGETRRLPVGADHRRARSADRGDPAALGHRVRSPRGQPIDRNGYGVRAVGGEVAAELRLAGRTARCLRRSRPHRRAPRAADDQSADPDRTGSATRSCPWPTVAT